MDIHADPRAEYLKLANRPSKAEFAARQVVQDVVDGRRQLTPDQARAFIVRAAAGALIGPEVSNRLPGVLVSIVVANAIPEAKTEEGRWFRSYLAERLTWIPQNMTNDVVDRVKSIDAEDCFFAIFSAFSSMEPGSNRDCFLGNWSWAVMNSLKRMNVTANQFRLAADAIISATPAGKKDKVRFEYGALARL